MTLPRQSTEQYAVFLCPHFSDQQPPLIAGLWIHLLHSHNVTLACGFIYSTLTQQDFGLWIHLLHTHTTGLWPVDSSPPHSRNVTFSPSVARLDAPSVFHRGFLPPHGGRVPCPSRRRGSVLGTELGTDGCAGFTIYAL